MLRSLNHIRLNNLDTENQDSSRLPLEEFNTDLKGWLELNLTGFFLLVFMTIEKSCGLLQAVSVFSLKKKNLLNWLTGYCSRANVCLHVLRYSIDVLRNEL